MDIRQNALSYPSQDTGAFRAYEYLGAHLTDYGGCTFRILAPSAKQAYLVGDFCDWQNGILMDKVDGSGVWETTLGASKVRVGQKYKYKIVTEVGETLRSDAYAYGCEQNGDASVVCETRRYAWRDSGWLSYRRGGVGRMNIYGVELGTFLRCSDGSYMSYSALACELAPYVKQMGYTHISLCDICQRTEGGEIYSYFAPDSRFGTSADFAGFVDSMHEAGVGVIVELGTDVFPSVALGRYDGHALYERDVKGEGIFDLSRESARSMLGSAVCMWLDKYHIDGIYWNGVGKTLSLTSGVSRHKEARSFFRSLNRRIREHFDGVVVMAQLPDDCTDEFDFDTVRSTVECAQEDSLVSVERDDVKHVSLMERTSGDYGDRFTQLREMLARMMAAKGHKYLFMGCEIGQFNRWSADRATEFFLLDYESHASLQAYVAELNAKYIK